jgi:OOP family OmpA-OmpF porin
MTRRQRFHALALLAAWAMSAPAAAGNYLVLTAGESTVQDWSADGLAFDGSNISNGTAEDTDTALRVALGFAASDNLTFEIAYVDLGAATADGTSDGTGVFWAPGPVNVTAAIDGYDFGFIGRMPTSETFALLARVGIFMWELRSSVEDSAGSFSGTEDGDDPFFGIGAEFNVSPSVAFRGEFMRYAVDDIDVDALSLSAVIRFDD